MPTWTSADTTNHSSCKTFSSVVAYSFVRHKSSTQIVFKARNLLEYECRGSDEKIQVNEGTQTQTSNMCFAGIPQGRPKVRSEKGDSNAATRNILTMSLNFGLGKLVESRRAKKIEETNKVVDRMTAATEPQNILK